MYWKLDLVQDNCTEAWRNDFFIELAGRYDQEQMPEIKSKASQIKEMEEENGWIDNFRVTLFDKDTLNFLRSLN